MDVSGFEITAGICYIVHTTMRITLFILLSILFFVEEIEYDLRPVSSNFFVHLLMVRRSLSDRKKVRVMTQSPADDTGWSKFSLEYK